MPATYHVAVLVGSLRHEGFTQRLAMALMTAAPKRLVLRQIAIGDLPPFTEIRAINPPPVWAAFRRNLHAANAVLIVTPDESRFTPGPMKNAIDVGSRPYNRSVFDGKPVAIASHCAAPPRGLNANRAIRPHCATPPCRTRPQPDDPIAAIEALFAETGTLTDDRTRHTLSTFMSDFAAWIDIHARSDLTEKVS
jgi:chromate reductase, NAD(P)H dehydrogenase (quinone)